MFNFIFKNIGEVHDEIEIEYESTCAIYKEKYRNKTMAEIFYILLFKNAINTTRFTITISEKYY